MVVAASRRPAARRLYRRRGSAPRPARRLRQTLCHPDLPPHVDSRHPGRVGRLDDRRAGRASRFGRPRRDDRLCAPSRAHGRGGDPLDDAAGATRRASPPARSRPVRREKRVAMGDGPPPAPRAQRHRGRATTRHQESVRWHRRAGRPLDRRDTAISGVRRRRSPGSSATSVRSQAREGNLTARPRTVRIHGRGDPARSHAYRRGCRGRARLGARAVPDRHLAAGGGRFIPDRPWPRFPAAAASSIRARDDTAPVEWRKAAPEWRNSSRRAVSKEPVCATRGFGAGVRPMARFG